MAWLLGSSFKVAEGDAARRGDYVALDRASHFATRAELLDNFHHFGMSLHPAPAPPSPPPGNALLLPERANPVERMNVRISFTFQSVSFTH